MLNNWITIVSSLAWNQWVDFIIVFALFFALMQLVKSTKALHLVQVVLGILVIYALSSLFELRTLGWVLENFATILGVTVAIVFQPELRRIFDKMRHRQFWASLFSDESAKTPTTIKFILNAVDALAKQSIGALIVLESQDNLEPHMESGLPIRGQLSAELLTSLFWNGSPTHDGAVIIRGNQILAAGCMLPLTQSKIIDRRLGTRHKAAIGLAEQTDALVIVISEETGTISIVEGGNISRFLNREALETRLFNLYKETSSDEPKKS